MLLKNYARALKKEFSGYNGKSFGKDVLAGITVAAVALPLALAFGVSSGADAAAGLITAIIAGLLIGALSGGSYQISGPTGAMTAILLPLVAQYKMQGVFVACFISGIILILCGVLRLGALVSFIPAPVLTGFTSGIAIIIALGQIPNLTGLVSSGETTIEKLAGYFTTPQSPNLTGIIIGAAVIVFMAVYPKKLNQYFPGSLFAIILATAANLIFRFDVPAVGEIPRSLLLDNRLSFSQIDLAAVKNLIAPAISIAALGLIESLLCGASAGRMKNEKLDADRELIAQGIGNMVIPFLGGVPATAAIARTSVAIKSGGQTRLTSIIHSVVLLLSMFLLAPVMSAIPLSALSGVLIMTAWRMNEWGVIKGFFSKRLKTAIAQFLITMVATVVFDLTLAILIGIIFSIAVFVVKVSDMQVSISDIDHKRLTDDACDCEQLENAAVAYLTGPLYFGTVGRLEDKLHELSQKDIIIISMRGVPFADMSGVQGLSELCTRLSLSETSVYFSCVQPNVAQMFDRCGLTENIGQERFFWSTDKVLSHIASN
ncbi:SulP family inorganic anion transporter [Acetanaerobacterium elongatum]|uniref:Sulfate permease, SulP family n=1 Tax=Acetanaerobacterium elongatum TaxID=258515 RepID=A0A1H0B3G2_9FIRM|nr:SulP family inorganic anion transporter [Acetanaerobacterium elongatum]SDN40189.1 sulfate permease, SulP family [Acetanaerobacterium elongatum]